MKKRCWASPLIACLLFCHCIFQVQAGNVLSNPGFESDPLAPGGTLDVLGWTTYGTNTFGETDSNAHTGSNYFIVSSAFSGSVNFNGVYQDYVSGPGATYTADGWAMTLSPNIIAGQNIAWLEVSFHDANANVLALYRSSIVDTNAIASGAFPTNTWIDLPVTNQYDPGTFTLTNTVSSLVAPPGTCFVRFQIVFQGDAANSDGTMYFDDLTLNLTSGSPYGNYNIVWHDEFAGTNLNTNNWTFDLGNGGWGTGENEYYTSNADNYYVSNGLHIVVQEQSVNGSDFTSARLKTEGLVNFQYGRFEWRARLPAGFGFWPALWFLGTNYPSVGWPACGEIDAVENIGNYTNWIQGTLHSAGEETSYYYFLPNDCTTNFHTFVLDWTTNSFIWYVDGHLFELQNSWSDELGRPYPAPFNQPFYMVLDVAVGGNYMGYPDPSTIAVMDVFPDEMVVDYVRLYTVNTTNTINPSPPTITITQTNNTLYISWPPGVVGHLQTQVHGDNGGINSASWVDLPATNNPAIIPMTNSSAFFRLESP